MLTEDSLPFITGMGYRKICDFHYDEFEKFDIDKVTQFNAMKIFVKTDYLYSFKNSVLPKITERFYLYTHNSDFAITKMFENILSNDFLITWYAQNVDFNHEKLKSIPIGLANKRWPHGNVDTLVKVIQESNPKENLVYVNFDIGTNVKERTECIKNISPYTMDEKKPFEDYLRELSKSLFVVSPNGNGVDCHKHWEALYLKTIPIVTKSINMDFYKDYPFLVIDKWSDFKDLELTKELYDNIYTKTNYSLFL